MTPDADAVRMLERAVRAAIPNAEAATPPPGYPKSLALCVLDSVWSINANYDDHVVPIIERYRAARTADGGKPNSDGPAELVALIDEVGGSEAFAARIGNRQRTSTTNGILKAEAVRRVATILRDAGITTPTEFARRADEVQPAWLAVRGQGSGLSFGYSLLLTGVERVKPDRMIMRFVGGAVGRDVTLGQAEVLVHAVAQQLGISTRALDHAIWNVARQRRYPTRKRSRAAPVT